MEDEEFGHRQRYRLALPGAGVALLVHHQLPALERARGRVGSLGGIRRVGGSRFAVCGATQDRLDAFDQQALREGLGDEVVGTHLQTEEFVDLFILGGEEDHWQVGLLSQAAQQFHAVHARHLDVEDRKLRRPGEQALKRGSTVGIGLDLVAFCLQGDGYGRQNIPVIIDKRDGLHRVQLRLLRCRSRPRKLRHSRVTGALVSIKVEQIVAKPKKYLS
ncbi:hypothetical protein D9M70_489360 [compost metagenome]